MALTLKRAAKQVRNAIRDPWPRRRILHFRDIEVNGTTVVFHYQAKSRCFAAKMFLPEELKGKIAASKNDREVRHALTAVGLALAPRFFKVSDFRAVQLDSLTLDEASSRFFENFLRGGLAEFRYRQGLDPRRHVSVIAKPDHEEASNRIHLEDHALLLNGGGKDTIVAAEMLLAAGQPFTWLTIGGNETRRRVIRRSGNTSAFEVELGMDGDLPKHQAYPWGHTPYAAIVMAIGALVALLTGNKYVISGNESSAEMANMRYRSFPVNHQYSKSWDHELGFWRFVRRMIHPEMEVFSLLRPFRDLALAQMFTRFDQYFADFISCNRGIASGRWCLKCPKCAFMALSIGAFRGSAGCRSVFGVDAFTYVELRRWINELVAGSITPWDCVGSSDECRVALAMLLEKEPALDFDRAPFRRDWERLVTQTEIERLKPAILNTSSNKHLIPDDLRSRIDGVLDSWDCESAPIGPSSILQNEQACLPAL